MIEEGDHDLALRLTVWIRPHRPRDESLELLARRVHRAFVIRSQSTDLFKFIWHGGAVEFDLGPVVPIAFAFPNAQSGQR